MKIDLSKLILDAGRKNEVSALLHRLYRQDPSLGSIAPCTVLEDLGLVSSFRACGDRVYRGTALLKDCVGNVWGTKNLHEWLTLWGDGTQDLHGWLNPLGSDQGLMGISLWVHLGRFPFRKRKLGFDLYWYCVRLPRWVIRKFEKSLRDPARERLLKIFEGPTILSKQAVLKGLKSQTPLQDLNPPLRSHDSMWDQMYKTLPPFTPWGKSFMSSQLQSHYFRASP